MSEWEDIMWRARMEKYEKEHQEAPPKDDSNGEKAVPPEALRKTQKEES